MVAGGVVRVSSPHSQTGWRKPSRHQAVAIIPKPDSKTYPQEPVHRLQLPPVRKSIRNRNQWLAHRPNRHTDRKVRQGTLANVMLNMDFNTIHSIRQVSAVITPSGDKGWLGIVKGPLLIRNSISIQGRLTTSLPMRKIDRLTIRLTTTLSCEPFSKHAISYLDKASSRIQRSVSAQSQNKTEPSNSIQDFD